MSWRPLSFLDAFPCIACCWHFSDVSEGPLIEANRTPVVPGEVPPEMKTKALVRSNVANWPRTAVEPRLLNRIKALQVVQHLSDRSGSLRGD
jgi:hypothetical protein